MAILIGIKSTHASGAYHGTEGFEGFSMDGTIVDVLKEGTEEELKQFAKTETEKRQKYEKALYSLEDEEDELSEKEYEKRVVNLPKDTGIKLYDTLLILEGKILKL